METALSTLDPSQIILTDEDLADRWGLKKNTIHVRRMKGDLPKFFRIGRFNRYRLSDVMAYEEEQMDKEG